MRLRATCVSIDALRSPSMPVLRFPSRGRLKAGTGNLVKPIEG